MLKSKTYEIRLTHPKDIQKTMIHKIIAETDTAAVAMAMYNMRDDHSDWRFVSVTAIKEL